MNILFTASEMAPLAKVGGLADVVGALPKALIELGHNVCVALPFYDSINQKRLRQVKVLFSDSIKKGQQLVDFEIVQANTTFSKISVILVRSKLFESEKVYTGINDGEKYVFFCLAIQRYLKKNNKRYSVVHCHDWHTALLPRLLKESNPSLPTILTIHNLEVQGKIDFAAIQKFDDLKTIFTINGQSINLLAIGIETADYITTVSPTYAQEILTKEFGHGLEQVIAQKKKRLIGILNGIDVDLFNPQTDQLISNQFSLNNLGNKLACKEILQKSVGLTLDSDVCVIGFVARFFSQKGLDLLSNKIGDLKAQYIFLGSGDEKYEKNLQTLAKKFPQKIKVVTGFDLGLAQQIYAGADAFLMPSRFEPCGLGQMIAMRYGTLPLVRQTGGLKDTVSEKNGFYFTEYNQKSLIKTIKMLLNCFYNDKKGWRKKQKAAMNGDYSWRKSAKKYLHYYTILANIK
ncbi:MAG: glycogen synthase [Candidatus Falkowbacteria bacterium]